MGVGVRRLRAQRPASRSANPHSALAEKKGGLRDPLYPRGCPAGDVLQV